MKENMNKTELMMAKGTMTIETFTDMMKDALSSHIEEDCTREAQKVKKNNGVANLWRGNLLRIYYFSKISFRASIR